MKLGGKGATSRGAGAEPWGRIGEKGRKKKGVRNTRGDVGASVRG